MVVTILRWDYNQLTSRRPHKASQNPDTQTVPKVITGLAGWLFPEIW